MIKMLVMYAVPDDKDAFLDYYRNTHLPLVRKIPGVARARYSVSPATLQGDAEYFCIFEIEYENAEQMERARGSEEQQRVSADVANYSTRPPTIIQLMPVDL